MLGVLCTHTTNLSANANLEEQCHCHLCGEEFHSSWVSGWMFEVMVSVGSFEGDLAFGCGWQSASGVVSMWVLSEPHSQVSSAVVFGLRFEVMVRVGSLVHPG